MVTLVTPTCDQPTGMALCERYMARQTLRLHAPLLQWIVVDDGTVPATLTMGQRHIRRERGTDTGAQSLAKNLLTALPLVETEYLMLIEHDDWYHPTHLEILLKQLVAQPGVQLAGDPQQRYYNVAHRKWRVFKNHGSCLCQTGMHRELIARFQWVIERCLQADSYGIDGRFWEAVPRYHWNLLPTSTSLGIKGLPGRPGLGVGHRPTGTGWKTDPDCAQLQAWIGAEDAALYEALRT